VRGNAISIELPQSEVKPHENVPEPSVTRVTSPWTFRQRVARLLWYFVEATIFRYSPRPFYRWRGFLLRMFGAKIHPTCRIRSTVKIEIPWNLMIGAETIIGDDVILYCLGPVTIGNRVTISQLAHLCAGTHDFTRRDFPLLRPPIVICDDVWIAADVFVGPGVTVGAGAVVGARSSVFHDLPAWQICVGSPAKPLKPRVLMDEPPSSSQQTNS
jgi:putative colanic acid biosynthesis acetyltransferase WcaF